MDPPINNIHRILLDAGMPSTINDLKNPTEDYIVNLLTTFLLQFCIDMNLIDQPSAEQLANMVYFEDSDIINLINLHAAVTQIFDKIFLSDFCITDITSPGQKRLRRQAKFLANFILYKMQKNVEFNDKMGEIQVRSRLVEELNDKKTQILESINNKALHKSKQLSLIKKLENEIQHIHLKNEKVNKKELELDTKNYDTEMENQKSKELCGSVKTEAGKLSKMIAELQSEVVHSPDEYQMRLNDLEQQNKLKEEERDVMQEAIQNKKQSIKHIGAKLNFVQKMNEELVSINPIYEQLKNQKAQSDNIKKQIDSLEDSLNELQNKLAMHKDQVDNEKNELQTHHEKDITPLSNLYNQLLSEKKAKKVQSQANKTSFSEKCLERDRLQDDIKKEEKEIMTFVQSCQEIYDNEIANELELQKIWIE